ncbi:magnesium-translocating P-type ATPase [Chelatococcus asaccharovorans]|uniref:Magnesium-transporting ATPase, P-type 1 n=1 Tax=Chelatococcus asaccharovorans TaxID=28210 RepID=A0A2V3TVV0_9HYPH|nr:magnesium-translocating P-type ATPase [Chelatococcus asaccharovorans]MBS7706095.1 magnesium-translocating P-type ATPase [Chelatococcus asaccharovorans]PXW52464.1 Mg2+-importing ATPase [Chelatococcus asaccharovorans]
MRDAGAPFWTEREEDLFAALGSAPNGLTSGEARERLVRYGANATAVSLQRSLLAKLGKRLAEPLIAILLIAAGVSGATGDWQSFAIITIIVLASIVLDLLQERKAEAAVEALKHSVAVMASVRRDGSLVDLPVHDIVPGDVVALRGGDLVPADGIVLISHGALCDESLLTGEPYPVEKRPGPCTANEPTDAFSAVFAGTSLVGGEATMMVVATGGGTRFGGIAASLQSRVAPTAFERGLHALGALIMRLTGFLVLFVLLTQLVRHGLTLESFLFAVALAVGLTPELLPMITTVTLSRGAVRMAARKVVVKRLSAIHDLGAMDILCTDKTGTLTEAKIVHVGSFDSAGAPASHVAELVRLNSRFASGLRSTLDDAILAAAPAAADGWVHVDDLPFDFERRRSSVLVARSGERLMVTKGAPEGVLALCTQVEASDGTTAPLDAARRAAIVALIDARGREGMRLLGVAWRRIPAERGTIAIDDEADLVFAGCAAFLDPPKASATEAVARLHKAGVRVKIISGDAEPVVRHLVETLALPARRLMTGADIANLSDATLAARAVDTDLFVRVSPDQKSRIVRALRRRGHTVGFIGDGINDAPAIHVADVGLSVDGGTDVAREAADIILLAPDLGVLADGVAEGRRTYANIMKYVRMGTSSNFGNMLSMALASLVLPFLPLAPLQVLLNNLLYDLSEIGIPFDSADAQELAKPRSWDMGAVLRFTLVMGPLSSLFDLATFALLRLGFGAEVAAFQTAWFVESIVTQILVIFVIRTTQPAWKSRPHPVLVASSLTALAAALLLALTPLGAIVGFVALPPAILVAIACVSLLYLAAAEMLKPLAMRAAPHRQGRRRSWPA